MWIARVTLVRRCTFQFGGEEKETESGLGQPLNWTDTSIHDCSLDFKNITELFIHRTSFFSCSIGFEVGDILRQVTNSHCQPTADIHFTNNSIGNNSDINLGSVSSRNIFLMGNRLLDQSSINLWNWMGQVHLEVTNNDMERDAKMIISCLMRNMTSISTVLLRNRGGFLDCTFADTDDLVLGSLSHAAILISANLDVQLSVGTDSIRSLQLSLSDNHLESFRYILGTSYEVHTTAQRNRITNYDLKHTFCRSYETTLNHSMEDNDIDHFNYIGCTSRFNVNITNNRFHHTVMAVESESDNHPEAHVIRLEGNQWLEGGNTSALFIGNAVNCVLYIINNDIRGYDSSYGAGEPITLKGDLTRGGINIYNAIGSDVYLSHNRIQNCTAATGAAISIVMKEGTISVEDSEFTHNLASINSGVLSVWGDNRNVTVRGCIMSQNEAPHASITSLGKLQTTTISNNTIHVSKSKSKVDSDHSVVVSDRPISQMNRLFCPPETKLKLDSSTEPYLWLCSPCEDGKYILGAGTLENHKTSNTKCQDCPSYLQCSNGETPKTLPGYWCDRSSTDKTTLVCYDCPSDYCKNWVHNWNDSCTDGRVGVLCGECAKDHTLGFLSSSCIHRDKCHGGLISVILLAPFGYITLLVLLPIGDGSIWKSASFFLQTFPLLVGRGQWNRVKGVVSFVFAPGSNDVSSGMGFCVGDTNYVQREGLLLYIPLATVALFGLACIAVMLWNRYGGRRDNRVEFQQLLMEKEGEEEKEEGEEEETEEKEEKGRSRFSRCSTGLITSCLLVYSGVISICLKLLFCVQVQTENTNSWVLYNAGNITCDGPWRYTVVAISAFVLLPSPFVIILLRKKMKSMNSHTSRDILMVLEGCYRKRCKYWETVYLLRKLLISIIYVLGSYLYWARTAMRVVILTSLSSHLVIQPFGDSMGQALETVCLFSLSLLSVLDTTEQQTGNVLLEIVLVVAPLLFASALMLRKGWTKMKGPIIRKIRQWRGQ
ncbi:hypothetical protein PROFUN_12591 [Planoprotostelium fungivorum]|uniref:Right handed beta helix domain-containing protein n=1 Tax=Planoprotostelium fungivorum TaxID=1890364 RepID=A0A2P6N687_9EUKA|nr:hypothetical protein PROFUN_12591 [Planoprotostelium fungivorum]